MEVSKHERKVLQMANGEIPWEKGAWVNACAEFLASDGLMTNEGHITSEGRAYLAAHEWKDSCGT